MDLFIVMEDLGDGDIALRYFSTEEKAEKYMKKYEDWCCYESNPRHIKVDESFKFNDSEVE